MLTLVLGSIVVLAWVILWYLEQSPYASLFHQHGSSSGHAHHHRLPAWLSSMTFLAGWLLMTIAMMLPTTVPLVNLFRRMLASRQQKAYLLLLLLTGYLLAWLSFGLVALALTRGMEQLAAGRQMLQTWIFSAGLFFLAGAFQFSKIKYACLDMCRTPLGFLMSHWHGRNDRREAFNIGWRHGLFCIGCCWALMLLMFAVSSANLSWMLVLAFIMAIEKNASWGRKLGRPLGVALIIAAVGICLYHLS
ncbi:DUF2182 domain-containing protein [Thalassomonas viridans]|uniref:DUF2182 domain-containing protein n=1 Tax=Thalassomonas viridans TaxID=137584 RepID=A0AAE9ZCL7_9GAMM|nr:DUF2182 domain-containing protein [Thalassomonas viridans]